MQAHIGTIVCKFGRDPVMFVVEEAIFVYAEKCPYHVTFDLDLDLDLEHTLDAGPCGDHRVQVLAQVWSRSSHVCGRRSDFSVGRKVLYHMTFDLDLDLEHTLDAGPSGDHHVQVW